MRPRSNLLTACCTAWMIAHSALAQPYGQPDRDHPGDAMIQNYLRTKADRIHTGFEANLQSLEIWETERERYKQEYLHMLGGWRGKPADSAAGDLRPQE